MAFFFYRQQVESERKKSIFVLVDFSEVFLSPIHSMYFIFMWIVFIPPLICYFSNTIKRILLLL